jgi:DNA-binding helix-hairpin-helix protein with protein kinase domain
VASGGYLLFGKAARDRRKQVVQLVARLAEIQVEARRKLETIIAQHRNRKQDYENSLKEVRTECDHYQSEGAKLQDVLVMQRGNQKDRYLGKHLIQDNVRRIPGLTFSLVSMLESFGIESALDVDKLRLSCIPNLRPALSMELINWRDQIDESFEYKPDHGITFRDLKHAEDLAVRRFKVSQARRVLTGAKQIDSMADGVRYDLENSLKQYDQIAVPGRRVAAQWKDFQSNRRLLERSLNHSVTLIATITLATPAIGWLLHLFLR